jgi:drug/metabolite transporter (DMT)-like permease
MTPFTALLAIIVLFTIGVMFVAWVEGLAFLAPKRTTALNALRAISAANHAVARTAAARSRAPRRKP